MLTSNQRKVYEEYVKTLSYGELIDKLVDKKILSNMIESLFGSRDIDWQIALLERELKKYEGEK